MNIVTRPAAPSLAARHQFKFDDALGSKRHRHLAVELLLCRGHEDPHAAPERGHDLWTVHDLGKMRRCDFLLAFRNQHQIYRRLPAGGAEDMKRGKKRRLW